MNKTKIINRIVTVVGLSLGAFALSALAGTWTAPTSAPPSGNVDAPINVGSSAQAKSGALGLGKSLPLISGLTLDVNGTIGSVDLITTGGITVGGLLKVVGGSPATGKVLTSDASGNATWQTPASSGGPVFITPVVVYSFSKLTSTAGWFTYDVTTAGIPNTAKAVILEAEGIVNGPNGSTAIDSTDVESGGNTVSKVLIRKDDSSSSMLLLSLAAAGGGDNPSWTNQGFFPLSSGTFQYKVKTPATPPTTDDALSGRIRVVGYFP